MAFGVLMGTDGYAYTRIDINAGSSSGFVCGNRLAIDHPSCLNVHRCNH